ncbi:FUSC family protein [Burkholderia cenocepacia]|nr:FUSC family protein [Burkholderia cenocepacia]
MAAPSTGTHTRRKRFLHCLTQGRQTLARVFHALKPDLEAAIFSFKCFAAAILALFLSFRIGLTHPFWAFGTVYIVSQPLAGASVSRSLFRFLGTLVGAIATVLLVPALASEPLVLSLALAGWIGFCVYIAQFDRTPRSYIFLLAGYTTSLIGFPSVSAPGEIFTVASMRVQEISIGVLCAMLSHTLVLPRPVSHRVQGRVATILADAERWTRDMLRGEGKNVLTHDRARAVADLLDLHTLSAHLPFDTSHGHSQVEILQALHRCMLAVLSLSSAVDDALIELNMISPAETGTPATTLFDQVQEWLATGKTSFNGQPKEDLLGSLHAYAFRSGEQRTWRDLLAANLVSDLARLVTAHRDCRLLEQELKSARPDWKFRVPRRLTDSQHGYVLHRDHWLAARAAVGTATGITLGCIFWITTAWADGATAIAIMGTLCALFGTVDAPARNVARYLTGSTLGVAVGLLYGFVILPRTTDFVSLAAVLAPVLLTCGAFQARPPFTFAALGMVLTFPIVAGLGTTNASDFSSAINSGLALLIGAGMAVISTRLFQTVGASHASTRILRAIRRDVVRRISGHAADGTEWTSRMFDRVGLLASRLPRREESTSLLRRALADIRMANAAVELRGISHGLSNKTAQLLLANLPDVLMSYLGSDKLSGIESSVVRTLGCFEQTKATLMSNATSAHEPALELLSSLRRDLLAHAFDQGA